VTPAGKIAPQPWMEAAETGAVMAALATGGAIARFVGGCVRYAVLGRPVRDIDIATPEPPETVIGRLEAAGIRAVPTGIEHGTVTAVIGARHFEITTLRRDVETFGRRARVAFTDDWTADALRRDFTINAIFCDPDGALYDPTGGLADLRAGRVRFVGDPVARIEEDLLRLLRFFRFLAHYGRGDPDPTALAACRRLAPRLPGLSAERVRGELLRLLAAPEPSPVLTLMIESGVMRHALPEIVAVDALAELSAVEGATPDPLRRLALLLRRGGDDAEAVGRRLKMSRREIERLAAMVAPKLAIGAGLDPRGQRRALYRLGRDRFVDLVYLAWAEALAAAPDRAAALARAFGAMLATAREWQSPELPVKGADALALGLPPGPEVGRLLARVEAWWMAGDFRAGRDRALAELRRLAAEGDA